MRLTPPVHPAWASTPSHVLRLAEDLGQRAARLGLANACGDASEGGEHPIRVCYRMGYSSATNRMRREAEREAFRLQRRFEISQVGDRRGAPRRPSHRRRLKLALDRAAARREQLAPIATLVVMKDTGLDFQGLWDTEPTPIHSIEVVEL